MPLRQITEEKYEGRGLKRFGATRTDVCVLEDPRLESWIYKKDIKNKRVSENRWDDLLGWSEEKAASREASDAQRHQVEARDTEC